VHVCRYCGLLDASVAAHQSATALDPGIRTSIGLTRLARFEYDRAMQAAGSDVDDDLRIIVLIAMDHREEALQIARRLTARISDRDNTEPMRRALRLYLENRREEAVTALHEASGVDPANDTVWPHFPDGEDAIGIAYLYARLGRNDLAQLGFRAGVEQGYFCASQFERHPLFDPLRSHPGFQETMSLARQRHERAAAIFADEGGPRLLGVR